MRIRRVALDERHAGHQQWTRGGWVALPDPPPGFDAANQLLIGPSEHAGTDPTAPGPLLPFAPLSFRDLNLFERHNIDAARGYLARFHPLQWRMTRMVEALSRRPFPLFRPRPLWYRTTVYYFGNALTVRSAEEPVAWPSLTNALDYEAEIGFFLSRSLLDATEDEALDATAGFVLINDLTARDLQRAEMASGFGPQKSKHFATVMSTTAQSALDVIPDLGRLEGQVLLNGRTVATISDREIHHSIGRALADLSRAERLYPGELFATGTLPGGSGIETGTWLRRGDRVSFELEPIGTLETVVV